jgi:hypothetical protein
MVSVMMKSVDVEVLEELMLLKEMMEEEGMCVCVDCVFVVYSECEE